MIIKDDLCIGCQKCVKFCPVEAITYDPQRKKCSINFEECVECGSCLRQAKCPKNAIENSPEAFKEPRIQRKAFSDPMFDHPSVKFPGRGTEEVKSNDVTGVVRRGQLAFGLEMGRPVTGTTLKDVEHVVKRFAEIGVYLPKHNALYYLFKDVQKGELDPSYKNERALSAIVEFTIPITKLSEVMKIVKEVEKEIDTVFSLAIFGRFEEDGKTLPWVKTLEEYGIKPNIHAKVNVGLGRPLVTD